MPSFVSGPHKGKKSPIGVWEPAKERAFDPKTGEIYDGPDRAALEYIASEGGTVGQDALRDPQLAQAARNAGFSNVKDYLEFYAPSEAEVEKIEKAQTEIVTHKLPSKKPGVNPSKGGFHDEKSDAMTEFNKKA